MPSSVNEELAGELTWIIAHSELTDNTSGTKKVAPYVDLITVLSKLPDVSA